MRQDQAAAGVGDAPTPAFGPGSTDGLVVGDDSIGEAQTAAVVPDAATTVRPAAGDGQPVHGHVDAAADLEDPAGVVAADCEPVGARAVDPQVVGDAQLAAGQGDGALQAAGESAHVGPGVAVGVEDRLPQRAGAAVGEVQDREGARQGPAFQGLQPGHEAPSLVPIRVSGLMAPGAPG